MVSSRADVDRDPAADACEAGILDVPCAAQQPQYRFQLHNRVVWAANLGPRSHLGRWPSSGS
jgi:hypothetical protein